MGFGVEVLDPCVNVSLSTDFKTQLNQTYDNDTTELRVVDLGGKQSPFVSGAPNCQISTSLAWNSTYSGLKSLSYFVSINWKSELTINFHKLLSDKAA